MSDYPKDWEEVKLSNILMPEPFHDYICKKTSNIGKYPIIQQGDEPIYGYAESKPYEEYKKVLLFGDHTLSLYRPIKPFLLSSDGVKILKCSDEFNRDYVFYLLKNYMPESEGYKRHYTVIKNIELMITEKKQEQKAIADTLMTFDKHIENLENLIEKKKMIRDGAVEDLITGKTRLDGFGGEWEKVTILDLMSPYGGLSGKSSKDFKDGNKKYISYLKVFNNLYIEKVDTKVIIKKNEMQNAVNKGDIIFTQSSETLDEVGMASTYLGEEEVYLNSFCFGTRKKREFNSVFMVLLLRSDEIRKKISTEGQGSTRYNLSPNRLMNIELLIPSLKEQEAIAEILTSMDDEIQDLEDEKAKVEKIRSGAMDDLLTGKVRLV